MDTSKQLELASQITTAISHYILGAVAILRIRPKRITNSGLEKSQML